MKIFKIITDIDRYRTFLPVDEVGFRSFEDLDGTPRRHLWTPPRVRVVGPELETGNFYSFGGGFLITDQKATRVLCTLFEMAGELLPLPYNGELYTVLNVTECINCLDHEGTVWTGSRRTELEYITNYMFKMYHLSESPIFKIPEECNSAVFVVEGLMGAGEELREIVAEEKLKGLIFKEIWSD